MENTESPTRDRLTLEQGITQLTAVNAAKVLTVLCLIGCSLVFGVSDLRPGHLPLPPRQLLFVVAPGAVVLPATTTDVQ